MQVFKRASKNDSLELNSLEPCGVTISQWLVPDLLFQDVIVVSPDFI